MKGKQPKPKLNRLILDEASDWFVDFRVGDVDSTARERFDRWLRQSPEHIRAYMEIANTYMALPALNPTRKVDVQELIAYARTEGNIVPFDHATRPNQPFSPAADSDHALCIAGEALGHPSLWSRGSKVIAFAASLAIACVVTGLLAWLALQQHSTYATEIGERRSVTLADGSTIDLDAHSKVRIKFSKAERDVELLEGQALFEVAKDRARPFIVRSGAALVRAVGTQFDVYRKKNEITVTVVEGRVAVLTPAEWEAGGEPASGRGPRMTQTVSAGEQVTVIDGHVAEPKRADVAVTTAWTQRRLVFDGSRLSDVVDEFNRHNARQIVIDDRQLDEFHISGVYSSTDPASLIRFLRQQSGIDVIETDDSVRIARK